LDPAFVGSNPTSPVKEADVTIQLGKTGESASLVFSFAIFSLDHSFLSL
jgi:hypothetical protein